MSKRVLIVEDDDAIARLLEDNLAYEGFSVERAGTLDDGLVKLEVFSPELVLLDLMLPEANGLDLCRALGSRRQRPPIIIISARSEKDDKVSALDLGADDYVTKPFALEELLARIRAVLRRHNSTLGLLRIGDVEVDFRFRRASLHGVDLGLSHREFQVLQYLAERPGKLVTRATLLQEVWGYHQTPFTRSVDISIVRLRRKIERDPHRPRFIRTLHGDGYSLTPDE